MSAQAMFRSDEPSSYCDLTPRLSGLGDIATAQHDVRTKARELFNGLAAEARCRSRDRASRKVVARQLRPVVEAGPQLIADPGETRHDGRLDRPVDGIAATLTVRQPRRTERQPDRVPRGRQCVRKHAASVRSRGSEVGR